MSTPESRALSSRSISSMGVAPSASANRTDPSYCVHDSRPNGVALAMIGGQPDDPELRELLGQNTRYGGGTVAASIVYQDDLESPLATPAVAHYILNRWRDSGLFIVRRNDYG